MLHLIIYKKSFGGPWLVYSEVFKDKEKCVDMANALDFCCWLIVSFNTEFLN